MICADLEQMAKQTVWFAGSDIMMPDYQGCVCLFREHKAISHGMKIHSVMESTLRHNERSARENLVMSRRGKPIHSRDVMSSIINNVGPVADSSLAATMSNSGRRIGLVSLPSSGSGGWTTDKTSTRSKLLEPGSCVRFTFY